MNSIVHAVLTPYAASNLIIDPKDPTNDNSGGGCRAAFFNLVRELAKYGHEVRAFSSFKERHSQDGVKYLPYSEIDSHGQPNVMWACYDTRPLHGRVGMLRIGSHHSYHLPDAPFSCIDINTVPSQVSLDTLKSFWAPRSKWMVLPNAVGEVPEWKPVAGRVVYHAASERGLHHLLHAWPQIKSRVPDATLCIIADFEKWARTTLSQIGMENSEQSIRARLLLSGFDLAKQAGGVIRLANVPRPKLLAELAKASVFAFPCSTIVPCETFSISVMECCKIGVPVVLAPQDALESVYKGHVLLTPSPVEEHIAEFVDNVVHVLKDNAVSSRYSELGKKLASEYTYEQSGKVLNQIICENTGFVSKTYSKLTKSEYRAPKSSPHKKLAFLLDPWACVRPINPEVVFTDSRGLTGSEITNLMQAIEMAKLGHDVTMYSNFTRDMEAHGIKFARWDRWASESKQDWYSAFATIHPGGLQQLRYGTLRILNQQVNDFGYCNGWEQYTDVVTALSHAHKRHLSQFSSFTNWIVLPNGCDPSAYHEGPRNNKKLVFASSPDRGLHWLLELFPRLKRQLSDVECHIYYNFQDNAAQIYRQLNEPEMVKRFEYIDLALPKLIGKGVFHHKSVSRQEMNRILSESRILAYTCDPVRFTEGFSCTTLEAAVAGCLPVICGTDALGEIYGDFVPTTPAPYMNNKDHYFENLVRYLTDDNAYRIAQLKAKEMAKTHNWAAVAQQLQLIMDM